MLRLLPAITSLFVSSVAMAQAAASSPTTLFAESDAAATGQSQISVPPSTEQESGIADIVVTATRQASPSPAAEIRRRRMCEVSAIIRQITMPREPSRNVLRSRHCLETSAGISAHSADGRLSISLFPGHEGWRPWLLSSDGGAVRVLAFAWGTSSLVTGIIADRRGRRAVLVCSLVLFWLLIGSSGLAASLVGLIVIRVITGFALASQLLETHRVAPARSN